MHKDRLRSRSSLIRTLAVASLLWFKTAGAEPADPLALQCSGCTQDEMAASATGVTESREVFVFDDEGQDVGRYRVSTTFSTTEPYRRVTEALPLETPESLREAFEAYRSSIESLRESGAPWRVPEAVPVKTVAGALMDEPFFGGALSKALGDGLLKDLQERTHAFWAAWQTQGLPAPSFTPMTYSNRTITTQFSDGSTLLALIDFSYNLTGNRWDLEIQTVPSSARTATGEVVPSLKGPMGWDGFEVAGTEAIIGEWMQAAIVAGLVVSISEDAPEGGEKLVCAVEGVRTRCDISVTPQA